MCFDESHYPDYRPGYKNYDRMWELLWQESTKITDFAMRKGMHFYPYNVKLFEQWDGYNSIKAEPFLEVNKNKHNDVYMAIATIE